jgi:hypothetical protein
VTPKKAVITVVVAGLLGYLLVTASTPDPSVEPTVQSFLLAWEEGHYREAAAYTTGALTGHQPAAYRLPADRRGRHHPADGPHHPAR